MTEYPHDYEKGAYNVLEISALKNKGEVSVKGSYTKKRYEITGRKFVK